MFLSPATLALGQGVDDEQLSWVLILVAQEIQKGLPIRVDSEKTLESVFAIADTIFFKYKVNDDSIFKNNRLDKEKYEYYLNKSLRQSLCEKQDMYELLEYGAKFDYLFINIYGENLYEYSFSIDDCYW